MRPSLDWARSLPRKKRFRNWRFVCGWGRCLDACQTGDCAGKAGARSAFELGPGSSPRTQCNGGRCGDCARRALGRAVLRRLSRSHRKKRRRDQGLRTSRSRPRTLTSARARSAARRRSWAPHLHLRSTMTSSRPLRFCTRRRGCLEPAPMRLASYLPCRGAIFERQRPSRS